MYSEWYSYHFPELVKIVTDNYTYARVAQYVGNRKQLTEDRLEGLEKILLDSEKTRAIYDASRSSMGTAVSCNVFCIFSLKWSAQVQYICNTGTFFSYTMLQYNFSTTCRKLAGYLQQL